MKQSFGGGWTDQKLDCLRKYLSAYCAILSKRDYRYAYIDAFAGTGWRQPRQKDAAEPDFWPDELEANKYRQGSAKLALEQDGFHRYIFIEKDARKAEHLAQLAAAYPHASIDVRVADANAEILKLCGHPADWKTRRALLFLDPFGLSIPWSTLEVIANTRAIDMWLLLAFGTINRMLPNHGRISPGNRKKLEEIFGDKDFETHIYQPLNEAAEAPVQGGLFEPAAPAAPRRIAVYQLGAYWVSRLQSKFPLVAQPLWLYNSRNSPIFLFCFAAANPNAKAALKIASHIIGRA